MRSPVHLWCLVAMLLAAGCRTTSPDVTPESADVAGHDQTVITDCEDVSLLGIPSQSGLDRRRELRGEEPLGTIGGRSLPVLFRFDLRDARRAGFVSARLYLHVASWELEAGQNAEHIRAFVAPLIEQWDEGFVTWFDARRNWPWRSFGGSIRPNSHIPVTTRIEKRDAARRVRLVSWDVTPIVRNWLSGRQPNYGLILWLDGGVNPMNVTMSEGLGANRPSLVIRSN